MSVTTLLVDLHKRDIVVDVEQGNLRVKAPKDTMTDELRQAIREHKAELLALLTGEPAPISDSSLATDSAGEYHSQHPQTDRRFVTRIKQCSKCGSTDWSETGRTDERDGAPIWGCTTCQTPKIPHTQGKDNSVPASTKIHIDVAWGNTRGYLALRNPLTGEVTEIEAKGAPRWLLQRLDGKSKEEKSHE